MSNLLQNFFLMLRSFKVSSLINITGMAVAFASLYIIFVQIGYDLNYNRSIKDSDRVYRFELPSGGQEGHFTVWTSRPMPEYCIDNIPAVEAFGCGSFYGDQTDFTILKKGIPTFYKINGTSESSSFLKVFGINVVEGKIENYKKPRAIAISKSAAEATGLSVDDNLFLGKEVDENRRLQVAFIYEDFPLGTDLEGMDVMIDNGEEGLHNEGWNSFNYYIKLSEGSNVHAVENQITANWKKRLKDAGQTDEEISNSIVNGVRLTPIAETYYKADMDGDPGCKVGSKGTLYTMIAVAALIVIIAFVNFINFFFALIPVRMRALNVRKIFGCSRSLLRTMLVFESVGLVAIALGIAVFIVKIVETTQLASLLSTSLAFGANVGTMLIVAGLALLLVLFASLYPAFYVTSFPTAMALKNSFGSSKVGKRIRYTLVGLQFTISIALIICAMLIRMQHSFMMNYDMGFNKENVITANVGGKISDNLDIRNAFESKLKASSLIKDAAWSNNELVAKVREGWGRTFRDKEIFFQCYGISWNFLNFMGIKVKEGRDFIESDEHKEVGSIIFNEKAKKEFSMSLKDNIGSSDNIKIPITGFCADFNFMPLQYGIEPLALYVFGDDYNRRPSHLYVRLAKNVNIEDAKNYISKSISEFDPSKSPEDLEFKFFDEELQRNYVREQNLSLLITVFSVLAIIISLMGVFGLVMFETQYRMKEIAIRRVHGASVAQMLGMFNAKFVKIVAICFVIAAPISYYLITYWLKSYAYKMPIYWWVFAVALLIVLAITVVTVTVRSYNAATSDPAKMVKSE